MFDRLFAVWIRAGRRLLLLPLLAAAPATAREPACHEPPSPRPIAGDTIGLVAGPGVEDRLIDDAIAAWSSCANHGVDFPGLVRGSHAAATVEVRIAPGNSGSKRCGFFRGRTITLYRWARTSSRAVRACGSLVLNLAHELGHVLGLADARETPRCSTRIMADLERGNLFRRAVSVEECRLAGARWLTLAELDQLSGGGFERAPPPAVATETLRFP